jgi:hypothetical protein
MQETCKNDLYSLQHKTMTIVNLCIDCVHKIKIPSVVYTSIRVDQKKTTEKTSTLDWL